MDKRALELVMWLLDEGRMLPSAGALLAGVCERLGALGIPILRANMQLHTLNPEVSVMLFIWHRRGTQAIGSAPHRPSIEALEEPI